jgi:hypothetical protein
MLQHLPKALGTLLHNVRELCPVRFYIPGGFLVVMPYARPLTPEQWQAFDYRD